MTKKIIAVIISLLIGVVACQSGTPTLQSGSIETMVATTLEAYTQQAPKGMAVSFQNVSFVIPVGLADGATSELTPKAEEADGGPWGVAPEHIEFTLNGYPISIGSFQAVVHVYPAKEYAEVNSWASGSIDRLRSILLDPTILLTNDTLPTVPFNGAAAQQYAAQAKLLPFISGNGVRMVSQYGQFPGPITKDNSFYHYEGLTADGKYMVAILFPVSLPLQSTPDNPSADGVSYPADISDTSGLIAYYQGITDKLNAASSDSFQPSLTQLDELIQSIVIQ